MADYYSDDFAEKQLNKLEANLGTIYKQGFKEMKEKVERYWDGWDEVKDGKTIHHAGVYERLSREYEAYKQGAYTKAQWEAYVQTQWERGQDLDKMAQELANKAVSTNQQAAKKTNTVTPKVYSECANYEGFLLEHDYKDYNNFRMVTERAVKDLAKGKNHTEFKVLSVNPKRDYKWNYTKIQNHLTQGILQGENTKQITDRFMQVQQNNRSAAVRNARTAITSAQNGGKMHAFEQAKSDGVKVMKEWRAVVDDRTRDSHLELDGVVVGIDEPFPNDLMYPGDPDGEPAEVYNCRCTMVRSRTREDSKTGNTVERYEKWKELKEAFK